MWFEKVVSPITGNLNSESKKPGTKQDSESMFDALVNANIQISLDQLLNMVPAFREQLFEKLQRERVRNTQISGAVELEALHVNLEDVDFKIPTIKVEFDGRIFEEVLLDGGSGVNILLEMVYLSMAVQNLDPAPFQVKMADQRRLQPLGILKEQRITISGLHFKVNFVVLRMQAKEISYPMLLGRSWFKTAKVRQDWGENIVIIRQGRKKVQLPMAKQVKIDQKDRPLWAQGINLAAEVEEDEEEGYLQANPAIIPVFDIDIMAILASQFLADLNQGASQSDGSQVDKDSGDLSIPEGMILTRQDFNEMAEKEL